VVRPRFARARANARTHHGAQGRLVLRAAQQNPLIQVTAINDPFSE
jgi:hypothetical protein